MLTSNPCISANPYNKWIAVIGNTFTFEQFVGCFRSLTKITNVTKFRDFQYRLLHKRIPSNKELYKWKIKDSAVCNNCCEFDSVQHMFFECSVVKMLWNSWEELIREHYGVILQVNLEMIVLNNFVSRLGNVINLLALILKQWIFRNKCANKIPVFKEYVYEIEYIEHIELFNTRKNNKLRIHNNKWEQNSK